MVTQSKMWHSKVEDLDAIYEVENKITLNVKYIIVIIGYIIHCNV